MRYCQATLREGSLDRLLIVVLYPTRRDTVSFGGAPMSDSGSSLGMISLFCLSAVSTPVSGSLALSSGTSVFVGSTSWMPVVCGVDRQAPKKKGVKTQSSRAIVLRRIGFPVTGFIGR